MTAATAWHDFPSRSLTPAIHYGEIAMRMIACLVGLLLLAGCASEPAHVQPNYSDAKEYSDIPGMKPLNADSPLLHGTIEFTMNGCGLFLMPSHRYFLQSVSCQATVGVAVGTWKPEGNQIVLTPEEEVGEFFQGKFRRLDVLMQERPLTLATPDSKAVVGSTSFTPGALPIYLVPSEQKTEFLKYGPRWQTAFRAQPGTINANARATGRSEI